MTADGKPPEGLSLGRWSQRKLEAAREKGASVAAASPAAAPAAVVAPALPEGAQAVAAAPAVAPLPSVESLTIESDFAPFFQPKVGETLKRQALKQLLRDPHFNVMDGLDVYVGDYSQPDPIDPDVVRQMVQGRYIFDPPATRINAQGHVEDVPPEEIASGDPADPVADAAGRPVLPSTQEAESVSARVETSAAEAGFAPIAAARSTAQAAVLVTAPHAPPEFAAAPVPDPGMHEPPKQ